MGDYVRPDPGGIKLPDWPGPLPSAKLSSMNKGFSANEQNNQYRIVLEMKSVDDALMSFHCNIVKDQ